MSLHRLTICLLVFAILFVSVQTTVAVWESRYTFDLYIMNMMAPALSLMVLILVVRKHSGESKRFWAIIAIAVACELTAQTIWGSYEWIWSTEAPEIGVADLFWVSQSFLYIIAFYIWLESSVEKTRYLFDSAILLVSLSVISWEFLMKPAYYGTQDWDFFTLSVDLIYPMTSLLMIYTVTVWLLNGEQRLNINALVSLAAGSFCYVFGDSLYVFLIDVHQLEALEPWIDPFWTSSSFCMALAGLYSLHPVSRQTKIAESSLGRIVRFSVPYIGLLLLVGLLIFGQRINETIIAGLTLTVVMILIRQVMFLLEREKLLDQLKQALARSEHLANYDCLTGLLNRRTFEKELVATLASAAVKQERVAVLYFDLDKFKKINDLHGHRTGDLMLQAVAERIIPLQSEVVSCARLGGDEFAVSIVISSETIRLDQFAGIIVREISKPFELEEHVIHTSSSVGIAVFPDHALNLTDLIKKADQAMYLAKRGGGGRFTYYRASS